MSGAEDHGRSKGAGAAHKFGWLGSAAAIVVMMSGAVIGSASAQTVTSQQGTSQAIAFNIPAQDLGGALNAFADRAGLRLLFPSNTVAGRHSAGLAGTWTRNQALTRLLAGSGLTYRFTSTNTVTIADSAAASDGAVPAGAIALETIDVQGAANSNSTMSLPPAYAGGQIGSGARLGFLGNRSIFDTPFSVSSYTQKLFRDQQATTLADVLANDASVRTASGPFGVGDFIVLRGFATGENDVAFDGMYGLASVRRLMLEGLERVDVMKGPAALLFGMAPSGAPGGVINLIPKRASDAPLNRLSADYLSNGNIGGRFDIARRFGADNAFGVRLNGALRDGPTPIENQNVKLGAFTAGLDYRGERFRASLDFGYQKYDTRAPNYTFGVAPGIAVPSAPNVARNIQQSWSFFDTEHMFGLARAEYDIARDWTVYGAMGVRHSSEHYLFAFPTITNTAGDVSQSGLRRLWSTKT
jgi:iron complex outermembrane receptor protein